MKRFALATVVLLVALIALPPLWFALFPSETPTLPPAQAFVDLSTGTRMHYLETPGAGTPIVLVHGLPGTAADWRELVPLLGAAGHRVIAVDRIGYGHSSGRADGDYTLRANTRDLLAFLDALGLEDTLVAGWSYGGVMAMDAAVLDDARIAAIALVASGGPSSDEDAPPEAGTAVRLFYSIPVLRWRSWVPPLSRGLMSVLSEQAFSGGPQPDWWLPTLRANFSRWETVLSYRGEILAPIETELRLDAIEVPTVVVHGDDDRLAPVAIGRYLAERIPGAAYQELEGASHMLPVTHAEALADALLAMVAPAGTTAAPAGGDEAAEETRAAPSPGR